MLRQKAFRFLCALLTFTFFTMRLTSFSLYYHISFKTLCFQRAGIKVYFLYNISMDINLILQTPLFRGIQKEEFHFLSTCLQFETKTFTKDQFVFMAGQHIERFGLLLSGELLIEYVDIQGNNNILSIIHAGEIFAESYAMDPNEGILVNVRSTGTSEVLLLSMHAISTTCQRNCGLHNQLISNLLHIITVKNKNLSQKIFHTTPHTIHEKLLSYLSFEAMKSGQNTFTIPFNRQQLADYLGVDRSALSHEISKLRKQGIIESERNYFRILR